MSLASLLPRSVERRAIAVAARAWLRPGSVAYGGVSDQPDAALLAILAEPFSSVDDAHDRMVEAEAHLRGEADRRSVFLTVYSSMTARVQAGIESGTFEDPSWTRSYLVDFANRYREAVIDFERGRGVPTPWELAFRASTGGTTLLIQDALLGINAHINYDLPYTLRAVGIDPDRPAKHRDHTRINEVLQSLVDVVQRSLVEIYEAEGYRHLDRELGSFDETFTLLGLTEARALAWRNAVLLVDSRWGWVRRAVDWRIRTVATGAAAFILAPSADRTVFRNLRDIEGDDPPIDGLVQAFNELRR